MRIASALGIAILLGANVAASAEDRSSELSQPAPTRACGHTAQLQAAKRALAEGDREGALRYLERARELVAACQRETVEPTGERSSATALAQSPSPACFAG